MPLFQKKLSPEVVLQRKIENYWRETAYVLDARRLSKMRAFLLQARRCVDEQRLSDGYDAYYQAKREYILARKSRQIYYRRSWPGMVVAVLLVVLFSAVALALWLLRSNLPIDNLAPVLAALGGGIGGCAAVLIQAIDVDPNSEVVSKLPWYGIKPVLGGALGFVTYFAITSGLNVVATGAKVGSFEGALVIGFIAGFFESFSTGLLARVANQFTQEQKKEEQQAGEDTGGEEEAKGEQQEQGA